MVKPSIDILSAQERDNDELTARLVFIATERLEGKMIGQHTGVEHAVAEADTLPLCNQSRGALGHLAHELPVRIGGVRAVR